MAQPTEVRTTGQFEDELSLLKVIQHRIDSNPLPDGQTLALDFINKGHPAIGIVCSTGTYFLTLERASFAAPRNP